MTFFTRIVAVSALTLASFAVTSVQVATTAEAKTWKVEMLNKDPDNKKLRNVFKPAFLKIAPGDTVEFISVKKGHNSQSIKGMIPKGVKKWKSKISKDFSLTLTEEGFYGYKCTPHYGTGMVGMIVVGAPNEKAEAAARAWKHKGKAKKAFKAIWKDYDAAKAAPAADMKADEKKEEKKAEMKKDEPKADMKKDEPKAEMKKDEPKAEEKKAE